MDGVGASYLVDLIVVYVRLGGLIGAGGDVVCYDGGIKPGGVVCGIFYL